MALTPGARLGPYEILSALGAGGMGEVYRATDTNLKRAVAIKVLPASVAADVERVARFQREAEVLASLNHPNIAAIYGLERSGAMTALVMELVEGPTLADRIAQGAIPLDEALPIATQMADALEAAHERGIIHRDLKPANVKVRSDGTVKVLDFGLAKALAPAESSPDASQSPTLSLAATRMGVILGTAGYMAPEQARGKPVDKRADIWAFGCVLYEMLTGRRAFDGDDVSDVLATVLKSEVDWRRLPSSTPASIRRLLRRCLAKERSRRLQHIGDARLEIDDGLATGEGTAPAHAMQPFWRRAAPIATAVVATALVVGISAWLTRPGVPTPRTAVRFPLALPPPVRLNTTSNNSVAVSHDGRHVVYVGVNNGAMQLYLRSLDQLDMVPIHGTENVGSAAPFFSPDSKWLGFTQGGSIKKISVTGGTPVTICDGCGAGQATWGTKGRIVFAESSGKLMQVSDGGGIPTPVTTTTGEVYTAPHFLPDASGILFTIRRPGEPYRIAVRELDTGEQHILLDGAKPRLAGDQLVFYRGGALWATPFDSVRRQIAGDQILLVRGISSGGGGTDIGIFDVARDGTLVYSPAVASQRTLVWVDRRGREESLGAPPRAYTIPRLSPDGTRVALEAEDQDLDIWIWDLRRATLARFTSDRAADRMPAWSPDGRRLAFASNRNGAQADVYRQSADGTGPVERLTQSPNRLDQPAFTPDGKQLVIREQAGKIGRDVSLLTLEAPPSDPHRLEPLVQTSFTEENGEVSPDGHWLAYESNESGKTEVYVRPFPLVSNGRWQMSTNGGKKPAWAQRGPELFYLDLGGAMMAVRIDAGPTFNARTPTKLFEGQYFPSPGPFYTERSYDVSADGQRFLMIKELPSQEPHLVLVKESWLLIAPGHKSPRCSGD